MDSGVHILSRSTHGYSRGTAVLLFFPSLPPAGDLFKRFWKRLSNKDPDNQQEKITV